MKHRKHSGEIFYCCYLCTKRFKMKDLGLEDKTKVICYSCVGKQVREMAVDVALIDEAELKAWKIQRRSLILL